MEPALGTKQRVHQVVEVLVMRELHVAAEVPRKSFFIGDAAGESTSLRTLLEQQPIVVAKLAQAVRRAETRGAGANNENTWMHQRGTFCAAALAVNSEGV